MITSMTAGRGSRPVTVRERSLSGRLAWGAATVMASSTAVLRQDARKRGMRVLREAGLLTLYDGVTSVEEIVRETLSEEGI